MGSGLFCKYARPLADSAQRRRNCGLDYLPVTFCSCCNAAASSVSLMNSASSRCKACRSRVLRTAKQHPDFRHCRCESEIGRQLLRPSGNGGRDQPALLRVRRLVAQLDGEQLVARRPIRRSRRRLILQRIDRRSFHLNTDRHDLVERRHRVSRADLAGILPVVVEVLVP
jgi:hypothetical protein